MLRHFRTNQFMPGVAHTDSDNMEKFNRYMAKFKTSASEFIEKSARQNSAIFRLYGRVTR
jgi:hypothetical protein